MEWYFQFLTVIKGTNVFIRDVKLFWKSTNKTGDDHSKEAQRLWKEPKHLHKLQFTFFSLRFFGLTRNIWKAMRWDFIQGIKKTNLWCSENWTKLPTLFYYESNEKVYERGKLFSSFFESDFHLIFEIFSFEFSFLHLNSKESPFDYFSSQRSAVKECFNYTKCEGRYLLLLLKSEKILQLRFMY